MCLGCDSQSSQPLSTPVYLKSTGEGFQLIKEDTHFHVRGVAGTDSLSLVNKLGGNTIRTYDTVGLRHILDEAHLHGISVIAGINLPKSHENWLYGDEDQIDQGMRNLEALAKQYRDHPALLLWCLGNEPGFYSLTNFQFSNAYKCFLSTLKTNDPNHPVALGVANFSDREIINIALKMREVELLIVNTFGRLPKLRDDMSRLKWIWDKPYIVGEYGINGPWETNSTAWGAPLEPNDSLKAHRLKFIYNELPTLDPHYLGALAFYWGQRHEVTPTWFNFFSKKMETNHSLNALASLWGHEIEQTNTPPLVSNLVIDDQASPDSFIFRPGSFHYANALMFHDPDGDSLAAHWEILPEDWLFRKKRDTPEPVSGSVIRVEKGGSQVVFKAPSKPGPFRLYVSVSDGNGHFSSTNVPIYVVQ